ncbi:hypothetical protein [Roseovarius sp. MMSF_3281]|uniref:hypothetical protein n=1 Tax=Roseovarius sp. MMSF_3281 TaxID=3046694 RepID=UPI00273ED138|nr:hypothetical protein [Roseovarius sp. MMSF_3281]
MKQVFALSVAVSLASPLAAQESDEDGMALMERGAQMFFEGIMREMEPAMKDLEGLAERMGPGLKGFVDEMGPAFAELMEQIDDLSAYHPPEMLPNGDIILRKKTLDEMEKAPLDDGEIEI